MKALNTQELNSQILSTIEENASVSLPLHSNHIWPGSTHNFHVDIIASCLLLIGGIDGDDMLDDNGIGSVEEGVKPLRNLRELHAATLKDLGSRREANGPGSHRSVIPSLLSMIRVKIKQQINKGKLINSNWGKKIDHNLGCFKSQIGET